MLIVVSILAVIVLAGALWVVTLTNLFRAALSLGVVLFGVAGLFIALQADFLGFVQILVYIGAILTLVVFAIMLTTKARASGEASSRPALLPALVSLALFGTLASSTYGLVWPQAGAAEAVSLRELGEQLVTTYVLPFELVSLVFVAAIAGAVALVSASKARPRG